VRRWSCFVVVMVTACGRLGFDQVDDAGTSPDANEAVRPLCTTPFDPPAVILELASPYNEFCAELTNDGLEIFWHDIEPAGTGGSDLWTAVRSDVSGMFGPRSQVANVNSSEDDGGLSLSADGLELYFSSERASSGDGDIFVAKRPSRSEPFGSPQEITVVNTGQYETSPSLSYDGLTLYFGSVRNDGLGSNDIWYATRPTTTSPFSAPQNLVEVNTADFQGSPTTTANGLALYYEQNIQPGRPQIWMATRTSTSQPFSAARRVDELYLGTSTDQTPSISASGERITFSSDRRATQDPYIATRVCP